MRRTTRIVFFVLGCLGLAQGCSKGSSTADAGAPDQGPPFDWTDEALPPDTRGCGDGILDPGESCDDGNHVPTDGCDTCRWSTLCGDEVIEGAETCDDGNQRNGDGCRASCQEEVCGDLHVDAPSEACDGQGACSACMLAATCGDGELAAGETCDDGNVSSWDGCSSACMPETVYLLNDLEFLTLASAGCDFSAAGAPQNAIGRALALTAFAWNTFLDDQFRDFEQRPVFAVSGFATASTSPSAFHVALVDATVTDPGQRQVTPAAGDFDYAHATLVDDVMVSEPADVRLQAGGAIVVDQPLRRAQFRVRTYPDVAQPARVEANLCGVVEARALAMAEDLFAPATPNAIGPCAPIGRLLSMTDLLAGGRRLGFVATPVDVDLDGDGLEVLIVAGRVTDACLPVVVGCVEGDGTVIDDPSCVFDFDDGWSVAFGFSADRASYVAP